MSMLSILRVEGKALSLIIEKFMNFESQDGSLIRISIQGVFWASPAIILHFPYVNWLFTYLHFYCHKEFCRFWSCSLKINAFFLIFVGSQYTNRRFSLISELGLLTGIYPRSNQEDSRVWYRIKLTDAIASSVHSIYIVSEHIEIFSCSVQFVKCQTGGVQWWWAHIWISPWLVAWTVSSYPIRVSHALVISKPTLKMYSRKSSRVTIHRV